MRTSSTLGARIQRARELAGLNKNQLARAVGTSWQHVDHWERDRTLPNSASLQRLAAILGVTLAHLLGEDAPVARDGNEAFETFLRSYAPSDLSAQEVAWLRAAPIDASVATPGTYVDLLHRLRAPALEASALESSAAASQTSGRTEPPPPRTGRRAKVQLAETSMRAAAKERRRA